MSIDDHENESPKSSFLGENSPRYESTPYVRTPSRDSTVKWPQGINEKNSIRKIDWSIIPILMSACFLQFLDKVVYNVRYPNIDDSTTHRQRQCSMRTSWACKRTLRCMETIFHGVLQLFFSHILSLNCLKVLLLFPTLPIILTQTEQPSSFNNSP